MPRPNVMPLAVVMQTAAQEEDRSFQERVLLAAVHGWMEGHVAAPHHDLREGVPDAEMASPPFPAAQDNVELRAIIASTCERFSEGEEPAAIAYASALGWQAGQREGMDCAGCALPGAVHTPALAIRAGHGQLVYEPHAA